MTTVLLVLLAIIFAIVAWRDFRFALAMLFALLPTYLLRFSIGPVPSTMLEVFILTLFVTFLARNRSSLLSALSSLRSWRTPLLLGLAAACFAASYAPDVFATVGVLKAYYLEPALVLLMLRATFTERADCERAAMMLVGSGVVVAVVALLQYATGLGIPAPWDLERRTTSVFDFPNAVGLFLAPIVSMLIVTIPQKNNGRRFTVGRVLCALVMLAAIITSETEAALIAIPAAIVVTMLVAKAKRSTKIGAVAIAIVLGAAAFGASDTVREKVLLQDVSGQARMAMWRETVTLLSDHPVLGAGLSGFPTVLKPYHDATFFEIFQYPHNVLLNIWVELGLLGVIVAVFLAVRIAQTTWHHRDDPRVLAVFAAFVTMAIHGLVDVPFFKNDLAVMTAGLLAFLVTQSDQNEKSRGI